MLVTGAVGAQVPGPRGGSDGQGGETGAAGAALPTGPFNRRVEVLVAVVDSPEEVSLATQLLEGRGWSVRAWAAARDGEADALGAGRKGLLVEVRLYGARFGAVRAAVSEIETLARRHQAGMWVVDAGPIEHELSFDYRTVFHAHRRRREASTDSGDRPGLWDRVFAWRVLLGLVTTVRVVKRPGRPTVDETARMLERGAFTHQPYSADMLQLQKYKNTGPRPPEATPTDPAASQRRTMALVLTGLLGSFISGFALVLVDGWLTLVPLALTGACILPVGRRATTRDEPGSLSHQIARGVAALGLMGGTGLLMGLLAPDTPLEAARILLYIGIGLALAVLVILGLAHALIHTWWSRHANWAVPALLPALALGLPWLGGLMETVYLRTGFSIPPDSLHLSVYATYAISFKPAASAIASVLALLALAGWARYFHLIPAKGLTRAAVGLLVVYATAVTLTLGLMDASDASSQARVAAKSGQTPAPYYGMRGRLVCLHPMEKEIAVFNGPLTTARPLLTFSPSGDRVWLWDPKRDTSLSVRLEDVVVTEARKGTCS